MAAWLELVTENAGWTLVDTGRLDFLVDSMDSPGDQYPSFIYFVGGTCRYPAMRALFPDNNVTRKGPSGFINLHLSGGTESRNYPVIFAESNYIRNVTLGQKFLHQQLADHLRHYSINEDPSSASMIYQTIISTFILPWTQVVCFFIDDEKDVERFNQFLEIPLSSITIGSQISAVLLEVIIVLRNKSLPWTYEETTVMFSSESVSCNITIVDLRKREELSPAAAFAPLSQSLKTILDKTRLYKYEQGLLFSGKHLCALWNRSLSQGLKKTKKDGTDCLAVARENKKHNLITSERIRHFLEEAMKRNYKIQDISSFLATAFLMNAYPPQIHGFQPGHIFQELYEEHIRHAWKSFLDFLSEKDLVSVLHDFIAFRNKMTSEISSSSIRRSTLFASFQMYGGLYSTESCLICLSRYPEHVMHCSHAICDTCAVIFGKLSQKAEYEFKVQRCPICFKALDYTVCHIPPTKKPVVLTLDGGGIRGIIQLGLLCSLEKRIGSIRGLVDLYVGTSVGALNAMDMVFNRSSATHSFQRFPTLARQVFVSSTLWSSKMQRVAPLLKFLSGLLSDGQYDDENLENILKKFLGSQSRMFDAASTSGTSSKVAIITSQISDGKACVFANYRGIGNRSGNSAYSFLLPQNPMKESPLLWEVARCSVAAPLYFKTKTIAGVGPLQDGGVRANNPLSIAIRETSIIWPEAKSHDLLISVGTGSNLSRIPVNVASTRHGIHDTALPRLVRATMASPSMDGQQGFLEALNFVSDDTKNDIHRLDYPVDEALPQLDDVEQLQKFVRVDYSIPGSLVRAILITGFLFFELDEIPVLRQGLFRCEGSILSKNQNTIALLEKVRQEFPGGQFQIESGDCFGPPDEQDGCAQCGYYRKRCKFSVKNLDQIFTIELSSPQYHQKIGGFPKSLRTLLADQQSLDCFGRADHSPNSWPPQRMCFCNRGMTRKVQFLESSPQKRKR